ncbi:MAG: DUF2263 domain-containing protein, partial [Selenomonadaceae bacterium]|nr:DUF2263 domain-containing protein [Selenomonadaceae bacterium]
MITWDAKGWLERFRAEDADYHELRREVWENTLAIVEDGVYALSEGKPILIEDIERVSKFYHKSFAAKFERLGTPPEITVTAEDCLDAAHKWVNDGLEVSVLNMAS